MSSGAITVTPSGGLNITCTGGGGGPTCGAAGQPACPCGTAGQPACNTTGATFTIAAPVNVDLKLGTNSSTTVTRSGGTGTNHNFVYQLTGVGCANGANTVNVPTDGGTSSIPISPSAAGTCTIALFATEVGDTVSAATTNINIFDSSVNTGGTGGNGVPSDCPTPASSWKLRTLPFGQVDTPRMLSGQVFSYQVLSPTDPTLLANWPSSTAEITFTQGQQPATPAGTTTEMTVSRCPGTIETNLPQQCMYKSSPGQVNNNGITIIRRPSTLFPQWVDQTSAGANGCYLTDNSQPYYVNIRWTYNTCPYVASGGCGFSEQWLTGPY